MTPSLIVIVLQRFYFIRNGTVFMIIVIMINIFFKKSFDKNYNKFEKIGLWFNKKTC